MVQPGGRLDRFLKAVTGKENSEIEEHNRITTQLKSLQQRLEDMTEGLPGSTESFTNHDDERIIDDLKMQIAEAKKKLEESKK
jgi:hypothetical protein